LSIWLEQFSKLKANIDKWRKTRRHNNVTLSYALEKGSPFHFYTEKAYNLDNFRRLFADYIAQYKYQGELIPPSPFTEEADFWLKNYQDSSYWEVMADSGYQKELLIPKKIELENLFIQKLTEAKKSLSQMKHYYGYRSLIKTKQIKNELESAKKLLEDTEVTIWYAELYWRSNSLTIIGSIMSRLKKVQDNRNQFLQILKKPLLMALKEEKKKSEKYLPYYFRNLCYLFIGAILLGIFGKASILKWIFFVPIIAFFFPMLHGLVPIIFIIFAIYLAIVNPAYLRSFFGDPGRILIITFFGIVLPYVLESKDYKELKRFNSAIKDVEGVKVQ